MLVRGSVSAIDRKVASSTLYTTLDDYARFVSRLLNPRAGSQYAMEESRQVVVRSDIKVAWALGLGVEDTSLPSYFHLGSQSWVSIVLPRAAKELARRSIPDG
jgi:hypothetical protein